MTRLTCDVVVLGSGPGGAVAAAACAARGMDVVVVERGDLRATHLPESWVGGAGSLLDELLILDSAGVPDWRQALRRDNTVVVRSASSGRTVTITSAAGNDEQGLTLDRALLDRLLTEHAERTGATIRTGWTVQHVAPPTPATDPVVTATDPDGRQLQVTARVILDATGKSAVLARALGLLDVGPEDLDPRSAVFTHIQPARSSDLTRCGTTTLTGTPTGYVFVIPISPVRTSVGVVSATVPGRQCSPEDQLAAGLAAVPDVAALVASGTRLLPVIPALNRTYRCRTTAGSWYALIGDAGAFTDPFGSCGLSVALQSGLHAADLAADVTTAGCAAAWTYQQRFAGLLSATQATAFEVAADGTGRELLNALTDPHLPPLLPLAAHACQSRQQRYRPAVASTLQAGRRDFAAAASRVLP